MRVQPVPTYTLSQMAMIICGLNTRESRCRRTRRVLGGYAVLSLSRDAKREAPDPQVGVPRRIVLGDEREPRIGRARDVGHGLAADALRC